MIKEGGPSDEDKNKDKIRYLTELTAQAPAILDREIDDEEDDIPDVIFTKSRRAVEIALAVIGDAAILDVDMKNEGEQLLQDMDEAHNKYIESTDGTTEEVDSAQIHLHKVRDKIKVYINKVLEKYS